MNKFLIYTHTLPHGQNFFLDKIIIIVYSFMYSPAHSTWSPPLWSTGRWWTSIVSTEKGSPRETALSGSRQQRRSKKIPLPTDSEG